MAARLSAAAFVFVVTGVCAGPEDEYRAGVKAFQGGDFVGAMAALKKPADGGHAAAQALLAEILDKSDFDDEALAYYRKSAAQGHPDGEYGLGSMYAAGEGVKRDLAEARKWITRAAEKGHGGAINALAHAYMKGGLALEEQSRTTPEALQWIKRAADNNYLPALEHLAKAYRTGTSGVSADVKQADALEARARAVRGIRAAEKGKKGKG